MVKNKATLKQLFLGILVGLVVVVLYRFGYFARFELIFEDLLFSEQPVAADIIIVAIDNDSLTETHEMPRRCSGKRSKILQST